MKLPELKTKFKNKYKIRIVSGVLIVALVGGTVSVSQVKAEKVESTYETTETEGSEIEENEEDASEDTLEKAIEESVSIGKKEVGKEETVFVISDNTGAVKEMIVSEHLINKENAETLTDASNLKNIVNVKGDETFTQNGEKLTWQAGGNDIYYQGTSSEKPPVTQKITYYLDGKEITPEELAGKSGKVTIHYDYTNEKKVKTKIDGKTEEIYVPFAAISGLILDESFSNIEVTNGKLMQDGNKSMVLGYALPGLKESLKLEDSDLADDVTIPDYFEVTADVENFSLDTTMTVVVNAADYIEKDSESSLSEISDLLNELSDASEQLVDGSAQLADGIGTLNEKMKEFSDGVSTLQDGVKTYTDGAQTLSEGIAKLYESTPELSNGVGTLNTSASTLYDGVKLLDSTVGKSFTNEEKENLVNQVNETLKEQEKAIKKSAKESVDAQSTSIKKQAEAAVDAQAENIKGQAEAAVEAQSESIKSQAEAAVEAQSESIKSQAEAAVEAQSESIKSQAEAAVDETFQGGQYAAIKQQASDQLGSALSVSSAQISDGIKNSEAYAILVSGVKTQIAAQMGMADASLADVEAAYNSANGDGAFDAAAKAGADGIISAMSTNIADSVVSQVQEAASTAVADAAYAGAKSAAGQAAVSGAKGAAGQAAVSGAKSAAGQAAVSGAKSAAGTAAVSGAKSAAGTAAVSGASEAAAQAAYEGAKGAAGTAAVSAAEQTKKTIADSINQKNESGYSLVSGMKALSEGTQSLADAVPELVDGVTQLNDGGKTLVSNNEALNNGTKALNDGTLAICDGVKELDEGADKLADGMVEFNEEGIQKIVDAYQGDIEPFINRIQAVLDAGEEYQSYTMLSDDMLGSVKFIYKTDAVKIEE